MRTFRMSITVQIPEDKMPLDKFPEGDSLDSDGAAIITNAAMDKADSRGLSAVSIEELVVGETAKWVF